MFLAPYRVLHFIVVGLLVIRFVPKDWKGLDWPVFDPLIKCGRQSLRVFCVGLFLSFLGYFLLTISSGTLLIQILISVAGLAVLCGFAYYGEWSKKADQLGKQPPRSTSITPSAEGVLLLSEGHHSTGACNSPSEAPTISIASPRKTL